MATFCALLAAAGYAIFLGGYFVYPVTDAIFSESTYLFHVDSFEEQRQ